MRKISILSEGPGSMRGTEDGPRYAAYPVQQLIRSRVHAFQLTFAAEAAARLGEPGKAALYESTYKGLRILGLTEVALAGPARAVEKWYGADVVVDPPQVRYQLGEVVQEPVMSLVVRAPRRHAPAVRNDLLRRDAEIGEMTFHQGACIARAHATQAELLGYADWLGALTDGAGKVHMWLSHYAPVNGGPGPAAA